MGVWLLSVRVWGQAAFEPCCISQQRKEAGSTSRPKAAHHFEAIWFWKASEDCRCSCLWLWALQHTFNEGQVREGLLAALQTQALCCSLLKSTWGLAWANAGSLMQALKALHHVVGVGRRLLVGQPEK